MSHSICRAVTFINYHIPLAGEIKDVPPYTTIGFFDGLFTERLDFEYSKQDLKELWKYMVKKTAGSQGQYSYQNIFCFSEDAWNNQTDEYFWSIEADKKFPLTFVVFMQLSEYLNGEQAIAAQCQSFNEKLSNILHTDSGIYYSYTTIDKNDFVICIKSRTYKKAVQAIKKLHETERKVVYSYTVFSIRNDTLQNLSKDSYGYLYEEAEQIDSICLKGITNSFDPFGSTVLDQKYYSFSKKLLELLYSGEQEKHDYAIYDILGDDDFRLIAREVNLGKLLEQYKQDGMLSCIQKGSDSRFYLYSTSMVLNTKTMQEGQDESKFEITDESRVQIQEEMEKKFVSAECSKLSDLMNTIGKTLDDYQKNIVDEKKVTICQAIWQLWQSLKALETAPTKKYDFYSLFHPFSALVRITAGKLNKDEIGETDEVYEFIHKISLTLHGTLRTDIQFFQIRDFNAIVHYAPAKLRAFYSLWALKLADYYNNFSDRNRNNRYSFIFSPGMFGGGIGVKQLFTNCGEEERLMLITVPERYLYSPRWLAIILSHEVSHFVGSRLRNREWRHSAWIRMIARIMSLELNRLLYASTSEWDRKIAKWIKENHSIQSRLVEQAVYADEIIRAEKKDMYAYHSPRSMSIIRDSYRKVFDKDLITILENYQAELKVFLKKEFNSIYISKIQKANNIREITLFCDDQMDSWKAFLHRFLKEIMTQLLQNVKHIMAETFADLMAVLTLQFTPEEYLQSFTKSDPVPYNNMQTEPKKIFLVHVRIGLVVHTVNTVVKDNIDWVARWNNDFCLQWSGEVWDKLLRKCPSNSSERNLAVLAYNYQNNVQNYNADITKYQGVYNLDEKAFKNTELFYLMDKEIWDELAGYLKQCAKVYMDGIQCNQGMLKKQERLATCYKSLAGHSVIDVIQEIENFLQEYEFS